MHTRNARGQFVSRNVPTGTKYCPDCQTIKPRSAFTLGYTRPDGLQPRCKSCAAARMRVRRADNPEREKHIRRTRMARNYGLTVAEYEALVSEPCAICQTLERARVVDHCHVQGHVRGALCAECNMAIGLLGDDAATVSAAAAYLRRS